MHSWMRENKPNYNSEALFPENLRSFQTFGDLWDHGSYEYYQYGNILDILAAITIEIILIIVSIAMNVVSMVDAATDRT